MLIWANYEQFGGTTCDSNDLTDKVHKQAREWMDEMAPRRDTSQSTALAEYRHGRALGQEFDVGFRRPSHVYCDVHKRKCPCYPSFVDNGVKADPEDAELKTTLEFHLMTPGCKKQKLGDNPCVEARWWKKHTPTTDGAEKATGLGPRRPDMRGLDYLGQAGKRREISRPHER